jgi:putative ABC transport system permease protein
MSVYRGLLRSFIARDVKRNPLRAMLTIVGISLGVAIWLAIWLANQTVLGRFEDSLDRVAGRTNLQIVANGQPDLPQETLRYFRPLWNGVNETISATPVIAQTAVWPTGNQEVVQVLGSDMLTDTGFRDYAWAKDGEPQDTLAIFRPNHAFISQTLANAYHLRLGKSFNLLVNDSQQRFQVAGILSSKGLGGAYSGNTLYMDIGTAQQAFSMGERINRIDLMVPKAQLEGLQKRLTQKLPSYLGVQRPSRNNEQVERMLRAFQTNLTTLSFIALLVSMFLIYNTMSIAVIRRRPEIGALRALGVSRGIVGALFVTEALLFGLIGSAGGLLLGSLLAQGAVKAVSLTVETLYLGTLVSGVLLQPQSLLLGLVLGVGLTVFAALPAVLEASGVSPAEATRRAAYETRVMRLSGPLALLALVLAALAWWAAAQPAVFNIPLFGYASALLLILAVSFCLPFVLQGVLPLIAKGLQCVSGTEGRLAAVFLQGALGRTAVAVASLSIGIAMMVSLAVMIGSFRQTVETWVAQTLKADLWIEPASRSNSRQSGRLSARVIAAIVKTPGIEAIDPFLEFTFVYKNEPANIGVGSMKTLSERGFLKFLDGANSRERVHSVLTSPLPAGLITESFAIRHHVGKGDVITLNTPHGPLPVKILGVYYDYSSEQGYLIIDRSLASRYYGPGDATNIAAFLSSGADLETVRQRIFHAVGKETRLTIRSNRELHAEVLRIFDRTFAITYALHGIAIIVAILGITNTLFALVAEAKRDFGILKYLGAGERKIRKIVFLQAGLLGFLGNVVGLVMGLLLAMLLIFVINRQSFGWTIQFSLPTVFLIQSFFLLMGTAVVSGWIPAHLAAKTLAPEVVRAE